MNRIWKNLGNNKSLYAVWLIVGIIYCAASVAVPVISGNMITAITTGLSSPGNAYQIPYYLLFFILACGLQAILFQADLISGSLAKIRQKQWMRTAALEGFSRKSYASSEERGALSSFLNNDIPSLAEDYFGGAVDILKCITLILLSAVSLLSIHWLPALLIALLSLTIVFLPSTVRKSGRQARQEYSAAMSSYNTALQSLTGGLALLRTYQYQNRACSQVLTSDKQMTAKERQLLKYQLLVQSMTTLLQITKTALLLLVSIFLISRGIISIGSLFTILQLDTVIAAPIEVLAYLYHSHNAAKPLMDTYEAYLACAAQQRNQEQEENCHVPNGCAVQTKSRNRHAHAKPAQTSASCEPMPTSQDTHTQTELTQASDSHTFSATPKDGQLQPSIICVPANLSHTQQQAPSACLQLDHLSCCLGELELLNNITLSFAPGKKYLITGPSGSGKTTLLKLLAGLPGTPYTGSILLGDTDIRQIPDASYYSKVCPVFQEPYLFHASLKENILLGRDVEEAYYLDILKELNLQYLLDRYKDQEITPEILEKLSGGERQRIALARAMAGKPSIYLLDEVTSALDPANARLIESLLLDMDATVIHIAHKSVPELLTRYDSVFRLQDGTLQD